MKHYIYFLEPFLRKTFKNKYLFPLFLLTNHLRKVFQSHNPSNYIIKSITNMNEIDELWSQTSEDYILTLKEIVAR